MNAVSEYYASVLSHSYSSSLFPVVQEIINSLYSGMNFTDHICDVHNEIVT